MVVEDAELPGVGRLHGPHPGSSSVQNRPSWTVSGRDPSRARSVLSFITDVMSPFNRSRLHPPLLFCPDPTDL